MANRSGYDGASFASNSGGSAGGRGGEFTRITQTVSTNTQNVAKNMQKMQGLIAMVGTKQDTPQMRDDLHKMQHYTHQLCQDTSKLMKELSVLPLAGNQSEQKQQRMLKDRLTNEFSGVLSSFQAAQRQLADREKATINTRNASATNDPFALEVKQPGGQLASPYGSDPFASPPQQQQMSLQAEQNIDMELMQERERELRQLEHDIRDVNTIFKDLAVLVHEQGETIDSIEANVENASVHVEEGVTQLQRAKEYQAKARKKKCILLLILLIVVAIIVVILAVTLSSK